MKHSGEEPQLFGKKYPRADVLKKLIRYLLERRINTLTRAHASSRRQLAVFSFDYISTQIILDGLYEVDELDLFTQWLYSLKNKSIFDGVAVDVGANIGNHSLYFSDHFGAVHAFEPHPLTYKLLSLNSEMVGNVKCYNYGLSSLEGAAELVLDGRNMSGARVANKGDGQSIGIHLKTLDAAMDEADGKPIRLLKIDVEGHESDVLMGAKVTIKKHLPIILFEQHPADFANGTSRAIELIRSYGYKDFAYIEKFPRVPSHLPRALWPIVLMIKRLFGGSSRRLVGTHTFKPNFYPFIVAIPAWLNVRTSVGHQRSWISGAGIG